MIKAYFLLEMSIYILLLYTHISILIYLCGPIKFSSTGQLDPIQFKRGQEICHDEFQKLLANYQFTSKHQSWCLVVLFSYNTCMQNLFFTSSSSNKYFADSLEM